MSKSKEAPVEPVQVQALATTAAAPPESVEAMRIRNERALAELGDPFSSAAAFRHYSEVAKVFSESLFVPDHFRGKPGDCLVALNLARRMDEDPLQVMQNTFVVKGRPGFYTAFMIARANRCGGLQSKIRWRVLELSPKTLKKGTVEYPNLSVTAYATDSYGEVIEAEVTTEMALAEDWVSNSKYKSMCRHMLMWRSAAFLIRLYLPDVMMGHPSVEELEVSAATGGAPPTAAEIIAGTKPVLLEEASKPVTPKEPEPVAAPTFDLQAAKDDAAAMGVPWRWVEEACMEDNGRLPEALPEVDLTPWLDKVLPVLAAEAKAKAEAEKAKKAPEQGKLA